MKNTNQLQFHLDQDGSREDFHPKPGVDVVFPHLISMFNGFAFSDAAGNSPGNPGNLQDRCFKPDIPVKCRQHGNHDSDHDK
mgnify:CR=1 FL=1